MNWLIKKNFIRHSGASSSFKIECDNISWDDIEIFAWLISEHYKKKNILYGKVIGVPRGGLRLAKAMQQYIASESTRIMIVDDVLSTGASMNEAKIKYNANIGAVMFSTYNNVPNTLYTDNHGYLKVVENFDWIYSVFRMD